MSAGLCPWQIVEERNKLKKSTKTGTNEYDLKGFLRGINEIVN
tara:strand:- start:4317 stop:4445 length:129 start_codon:yes stop_codon:yes gene_type:complete